MSGATRIPVLIPARVSSATASIRARGLGVCGSVARHALSSIVGIDSAAPKSARDASSVIRSRSRSSNGDLVRIDPGLRASIIACQMPRISLYRPSTH